MGNSSKKTDNFKPIELHFRFWTHIVTLTHHLPELDPIGKVILGGPNSSLGDERHKTRLLPHEVTITKLEHGVET